MAQSSSVDQVSSHGSASSRGRVLLIEDEPTIAELLVQVLEEEGYRVTSVATGRTAELILDEIRPDLVMLDLILPDVDGLLLCSQLRAKSSAPIVVLSGSQRHRDRVLALRLGADDFVSKPFDLNELIARVAAILRRAVGSGMPAAGSGAQAFGRAPLGAPASPVGSAAASAPAGGEVYGVGDLVIDRRRRSVTIAGTPVHLTPTENRLLTTLASEPGRVFAREDLAEAIWGSTTIGESRAVDVHIRRLRAKLEPFGASAPPIVTVRGFGYKLA